MRSRNTSGTTGGPFGMSPRKSPSLTCEVRAIYGNGRYLASPARQKTAPLLLLCPNTRAAGIRRSADIPCPDPAPLPQAGHDPCPRHPVHRLGPVGRNRTLGQQPVAGQRRAGADQPPSRRGGDEYRHDPAPVRNDARPADGHRARRRRCRAARRLHPSGPEHGSHLYLGRSADRSSTWPSRARTV